MRTGQYAIVWLLGFCTLTASECDWHTSPDKWEEARVFHRPFDPQYASRIGLDRCPVPAVLPAQQMAANDAYWFAVVLPDRTKPGPWNTDVLIHIERDYLVKLQFREIHYCGDIVWVSEKLLRVRVWWGRICGTDVIVDVEQEQIIYREMVWDGEMDIIHL